MIRAAAMPQTRPPARPSTARAEGTGAEIDLRFNAPVPLQPGVLSFSRASAKRAHRAGDGAQQVLGTHQPAFDHRPATGSPLGLQIEAARTNLAYPSENAGALTLARTTVVTDAETAPDGSAGGDLVLETAVSGSHNAYASFGTCTGGQSFVYSGFVKRAGRRYCALTAFLPSTSRRAIFDFDTGAWDTVSDLLTAFAPVAQRDGWWRLAVLGVAEGDGNAFFQIDCIDDAKAVVYAGDPTKGVAFWGWQVEAGGQPTSYVSTTSAAATRAADAASLALPAPPWTVLTRVRLAQPCSATGQVVRLLSTTPYDATGWCSLRADNIDRLNLATWSGYAYSSLVTVPGGTPFAVALRHDGTAVTAFGFWAGMHQKVSSAAIGGGVPGAAAILHLGQEGNGTQFGPATWFERLCLWQRALDDASIRQLLETLT